MIAAKEICWVKLGLERYQPVVITSIGCAHAMALPLVQRVDVDFAGVERLHRNEKGLEPI
jgi:hypothetical protein